MGLINLCQQLDIGPGIAGGEARRRLVSIRTQAEVT
jgi:hypothetical protein